MTPGFADQPISSHRRHLVTENMFFFGSLEAITTCDTTCMVCLQSSIKTALIPQTFQI